MPVCCVNFFVFSAQTSSSPWTNRFQRSTRSFAPFSGVIFNWASAARREERRAAAEGGTGGDAGGGFQEITTFDIAHAYLLGLWAAGQGPVPV